MPHVIDGVLEQALAEVLVFAEVDDILQVAMHEFVFFSGDLMKELYLFFISIFGIGLMTEGLLF